MSEENIEFCIPDNFIEQIYEFSGGADKYKGMILAVCSETGAPTIYSKYESSIVEMGLKKAVSDFVIGNFEQS
jgi:hypothetical protein